MKALVTGGGGYLGGAIVRALIKRGDKVSSLQRSEYPELTSLGVKIFKGDMTDPETVIKASQGNDVIFHVAGMTGVWGDYQDYYHTNVTGTKSVIDACLKNGITKLIYTSSPSVIFNGNHEENVDESFPYPDKYFNHYQRTKSTAEQIILAANNSELATVALRPHLIWGPNDPHLVQRIITRAGKGMLRLVKGNQNLVDTTYIENAAQAHTCAADHLDIGSSCAGKAYFITNGEPKPMSYIINNILLAHGMNKITKTIPANILFAVGALSEWVYTLLNITREPMMTRFIARQLSCAHWYNIDAAKNDLGYEPHISISEGMQILKNSCNKDA
jgi:nucleoside-diphosphate-sugar epimerase